MGARQSKKPKDKIYASDPKTTAAEACKDLEAKIIADGVEAIVNVADETSANIVGSLFSPRGTLNIMALARVGGKDHRVTLAKSTVETNDPYISGTVKVEMVVASVCIRASE